MFNLVKFFAASLLIFHLAQAQIVTFTEASLFDVPNDDAVIAVAGETGSSLTRILEEVNVFRAQFSFQLLFFAYTDSGFGLPVMSPFSKEISVDSLQEGTYSIRCFALNSNLIDSTVFFSPDSSTFYFPYNDVIPPDSLFILADTTFTVHYQKTAVADEPALPADLNIITYPNPFNARTTFEFSLPDDHFVHLCLFDLRGKNVATLVSQHMSRGTHSVLWDASHSPSGTYFYELHVGDLVSVGRLLVLK